MIDLFDEDSRDLPGFLRGFDDVAGIEGESSSEDSISEPSEAEDPFSASSLSKERSSLSMSESKRISSFSSSESSWAEASSSELSEFGNSVIKRSSAPESYLN